jgi:predicted SAM-dependent methyltransferase
MMLQQLRHLHDRIYLSFDFQPSVGQAALVGSFDKINYACGNDYKPDWLNVDIRPVSRVPRRFRHAYLKMSLTRRHPFADASFRFAYSEDFVEHLSQADSLTFLSEAYRTLAPDGVLRLSTPGLKGVLRRHFRASDFGGAAAGKEEAYVPHGHLHFYCEESLSAVAVHLGFRKISFKPYYESDYEELRQLETRSGQVDLNIVAELTK